MKVLKHSQVPK